MTVSFAGMTLTLHKIQIDSQFGHHAVMMSLQFTKSATLPAEAGCKTWGRIVLKLALIA